MKYCNSKKCDQVNPQQLTSFYKDKKNSDGYRNDCKHCVKKIKRLYFEKHRDRELNKLKQWKKNNPEKVRAANLRNNHGITVEQYNIMLRDQVNHCAICPATEPGGNNGYFCVDHCHKTGKIRGLLCYKCNIALGMINDDIEIANNIIGYLNGHKS